MAEDENIWAVLVSTEGWEQFLSQVVEPIVARTREKLLRREDLPDAERKAGIRLLAELRGMLREPYVRAGLTPPKDLA